MVPCLSNKYYPSIGFYSLKKLILFQLPHLQYLVRCLFVFLIQIRYSLCPIGCCIFCIFIKHLLRIYYNCKSSNMLWSGIVNHLKEDVNHF